MKLKSLLFLLFLALVILPFAVHGEEAAPAKRIYVSNPGNNTISVIDAATKEVVNTIRVGVWPAGMAIDPATGKLYVMNSSEGDSSISVVDIASNMVESTIKVGIGPLHIVVDSAAKIAYSTDTEHVVEGKNLSKTVSVIDLTNNTVKETIEVGIGPFDYPKKGRDGSCQDSRKSTTLEIFPTY